MNGIFKEINDIENIEIKYDSAGRYGFIIDSDNAFYLPVVNGNVNHPDILKFTIRKLYHADSDIIKSLSEHESKDEVKDLFTDGSTYNLAAFVAASGNPIFINTGDKFNDKEYYTGILFVPSLDKLTDYQKDFIKRFNSIYPKNDLENGLTIAKVDGEIENGFYKAEEIKRDELERSLIDDREKGLH